MRLRLKEQDKEEYRPDSQTMVLLLLMTFVLGGIIGFVYEEIFYLIDLGYLTKRGTTFGPWIPIYGFGAVLILVATSRIRKYPAVLFGMSVLVTGLLEYFTGLVLLKVFHVRLWDYNVEIWNWLNIGGFVCLRSVLCFGVAALAFQYLLYPLLSDFAEKCDSRKLRYIARIPFAIFVADIVVSLIVRSVNSIR